jgi:hypothetical protein
VAIPARRGHLNVATIPKHRGPPNCGLRSGVSELVNVVKKSGIDGATICNTHAHYGAVLYESRGVNS